MCLSQIFAEQNELEFKEDPSNSSLEYSRNRIRHEILPEAKKINPNIKIIITPTIDNDKVPLNPNAGKIEIMIVHIEYKIIWSALALSFFLVGSKLSPAEL